MQLRKLENASHNPYTAATPVESRDLAFLSEQIAEYVRQAKSQEPRAKSRARDAPVAAWRGQEEACKCREEENVELYSGGPCRFGEG